MQTKNSNKFKTLFLRQSYLDSWEDYIRSLQKESFIKWDYIILTASNEEQAAAFRMQIKQRLERKLIPATTKYVVLPDPDGKRVGSGGATFNVLRYLAQECNPGYEAESITKDSAKGDAESHAKGDTESHTNGAEETVSVFRSILR